LKLELKEEKMKTHRNRWWRGGSDRERGEDW